MSESFGDLVDRLFTMVQDHMKWDERRTALWFRTPNHHFGGITPDTFIQHRPEKAERAIISLINGDGP